MREMDAIYIFSASFYSCYRIWILGAFLLKSILLYIKS